MEDLEVDGGAVIGAARAQLADVAVALDPAVDRADADATAEVLVRLAVSLLLMPESAMDLDGGCPRTVRRSSRRCCASADRTVRTAEGTGRDRRRGAVRTFGTGRPKWRAAGADIGETVIRTAYAPSYLPRYGEPPVAGGGGG